MSRRTDLTVTGPQDFLLYALPEPPSKKIRLESRRSSGSMADLHVKPAPLPTSSGLTSVPISPPISPDAHHKEMGSLSPTASNLKDPVLFSYDIPQIEPSSALFPPQIDEFAVSDLSDSSLQDAHEKSGLILNTQSSLSRRKGTTALTPFRSTVSSLYNQNPMRFLGYMRNEWPSSSRKNQVARMDSRPRTDTRTRHDSSLRKPIRVDNRSCMVSNVEPTMPPQHKKSSSSHVITKPVDPKLVRRRVEDVNFEALPDFSPPMSALAHPEALRVDWPGSPIDLSEDPHRHLIDPIEIALASKLRLSCATYLCSKRRIFIGRAASLKTGKEFRKTDAQQACKIDVNKASKLWTAYENGGWFQRSLFEKES